MSFLPFFLLHFNSWAAVPPRSRIDHENCDHLPVGQPSTLSRVLPHPRVEVPESSRQPWPHRQPGASTLRRSWTVHPYPVNLLLLPRAHRHERSHLSQPPSGRGPSQQCEHTHSPHSHSHHRTANDPVVSIARYCFPERSHRQCLPSQRQARERVRVQGEQWCLGEPQRPTGGDGGASRPRRTR